VIKLAIGIAKMKGATRRLIIFNLMKLRQRICARRGTVQHQTKAFYFVALKFGGIPDHHSL
jgi:hypothetical protein